MLNILSYLAGRIHIPKEETHGHGPRLLHISDTPSLFFSELSRVIKIIQPDYIIHTGDLVDDIKLQLYPGAIRYYERQVLELLKTLNQSSAKEVYIALGNHDSADYINKQNNRIKIVEDYGLVEIEGIKIAFSHYAKQIINLSADLYLFGHDLTTSSKHEEDRVLLNGITSLNVVELHTMDIKYYDYPWGIDDSRLNKRRIGF